MLKLEVLNTAFKGKQFKLKDGLRIGSAAECQIRAQHPELQPVHARFYIDGGHPMVEIGCDAAHLFINGKDVVRSELRHNDELVIGPLRLKVNDVSRTSQPAMRIDELIAEFEAGAGDEIYDFAKEDLFYLTTKDPTLRQAISFSLPSKDKFLDQAQAFLARLAKGAGFDEEKLDAFMTCTKELILNAHRHGHKYDETKHIVVRWRDIGPQVQLQITDEGAGFDHKTVIEGLRTKDAAQAARERYQAGGFGGLGFKLILKLADDLRYNDTGNSVTFTVAKKAADG